jgi:hypothetical protein
MNKTRLNRLKYLKKLTVSVWFYKSETEKPNRKKPSQTETKPNLLEIKKKPQKNNIVFLFLIK